MLNTQAMEMKECWASLASVMEVKSILGQLDEFKYILKILDNDTYDNPALNQGLYKVDQDCLDQLKKAVLLARESQLKDLKEIIESLKQCSMIDNNQYRSYLDQWHEIKENVDGQLDNMGFDLASKKAGISDFKDTVYSTVLLGQHFITQKLPQFINSVSMSFKGSDTRDYIEFTQVVKESFKDYIEIMLHCAQNQVNIQLQRQD